MLALARAFIDRLEEIAAESRPTCAICTGQLLEIRLVRSIFQACLDAHGVTLLPSQHYHISGEAAVRGAVLAAVRPPRSWAESGLSSSSYVSVTIRS